MSRPPRFNNPYETAAHTGGLIDFHQGVIRADLTPALYGDPNAQFNALNMAQAQYAQNYFGQLGANLQQPNQQFLGQQPNQPFLGQQFQPQQFQNMATVGAAISSPYPNIAPAPALATHHHHHALATPQPQPMAQPTPPQFQPAQFTHSSLGPGMVAGPPSFIHLSGQTYRPDEDKLGRSESLKPEIDTRTMEQDRQKRVSDKIGEFSSKLAESPFDHRSTRSTPRTSSKTEKTQKLAKELERIHKEIQEGVF